MPSSSARMRSRLFRFWIRPSPRRRTSPGCGGPPARSSAPSAPRIFAITVSAGTPGRFPHRSAGWTPVRGRSISFARSLPRMSRVWSSTATAASPTVWSPASRWRRFPRPAIAFPGHRGSPRGSRWPAVASIRAGSGSRSSKATGTVSIPGRGAYLGARRAVALSSVRPPRLVGGRRRRLGRLPPPGGRSRAPSARVSGRRSGRPARGRPLLAPGIEVWLDPVPVGADLLDPYRAGGPLGPPAHLLPATGRYATSSPGADVHAF